MTKAYFISATTQSDLLRWSRSERRLWRKKTDYIIQLLDQQSDAEPEVHSFCYYLYRWYYVFKLVPENYIINVRQYPT